MKNQYIFWIVIAVVAVVLLLMLIKPRKPCIKAGKRCMVIDSSSSTGIPCCSGLTCGPDPVGNYVCQSIEPTPTCGQSGTACTEDTDCCANNQCTNSICTPCVATGSTCAVGSSTCCGTATCLADSSMPGAYTCQTSSTY